MLNLFGRKINDVVGKTRLVKVCGIRFRIKKLDVFDFASGSQIMIPKYQTYEEANEQQKQIKETDLKKIKDHYKDVFMSAVVEPQLKRKPEDGPGMWVDNLFTEPELVENLYNHILIYTYGKKKLIS